jgi:preprotein translocase subunit SecY
MSRLTDSFRNIFKIEELKDRIIFTIICLMAVRLGSHITLPGIVYASLDKGSASSNSLFGLYDLFVGGAFKNAAIFGLGIMPYISSSIIIQLLGAVVPYFQKLQREGEDGRKKITQMTRMGTVLVSIGQASGMAVYLQKQPELVAAGISPIFFMISTVICLTAGCMLMMWIGEQITERGIGNGISLIIFIGIVARFPNAIFTEVTMVQSGQHNIIVELVLWAFFVGIVGFVVLMTQGIRKIPVQYAKRVIGRKVYGGVTQHIPMRINTAGVMPIIFAQSILFIPTTLAQFFPNTAFGDFLTSFFSYRSMGYSIVFAVMIVFFTYFYTAIAFNPRDVADTMKKQGGFIPGVRPGKHTSDYIDNILTHITLPGAIFLAIVAILPAFVSYLGVTSDFAQFFGGTSLLIMVGVALDTLQQVESHLTMRNYEGLMKAGRIKGRTGVAGY